MNIASLAQHQHTYPNTQACQFYQRLLTCPEAAVIAVGLGHALIGILRRLSTVRTAGGARACVYPESDCKQRQESQPTAPKVLIMTNQPSKKGQRRLVPRHARPHALQPGGPGAGGGQGPCCPRVVRAPPLRRAAGAGGGGAGATGVGRLWWRWEGGQ